MPRLICAVVQAEMNADATPSEAADKNFRLFKSLDVCCLVFIFCFLPPQFCPEPKRILSPHPSLSVAYSGDHRAVMSGTRQHAPKPFPDRYRPIHWRLPFAAAAGLSFMSQSLSLAATVIPVVEGGLAHRKPPHVDFRFWLRSSRSMAV